MTERPRRATAGVRKVYDPSEGTLVEKSSARTKTTASAANRNKLKTTNAGSKSRGTSTGRSSSSSEEKNENDEEAKVVDNDEEKQVGDYEEAAEQNDEEESAPDEEAEEESPDDSKDDSWSEEEEEDEEASDDDSDDEDWSEEDERKSRRRGPKGRASAAQAAKKHRTGYTAAARTGAGGTNSMAYMYPPIKRFAEMLHSNYGFDFLLQSPVGLPTVDVTIGNFVNALEGSCETFGNASSATWLNESPPPNITSGTVVIRPVSMRIPAMTGRWMAGHLISRLGCCGAMFWHTDLVGPDAQAAANLIREFALSGMEIIEHNESEHLKNKGLRLIGRYSWDYYRQYGGGGYRIPQLASSLFAGPHCFFAPADEYKSRVYPEVLMRVTEFDNGQNVRFQPFLNRINHSGAMAVFPGQEYMFAKVFLQRDAQGLGWLGVRAMLVFTYNIGDAWGDCQIEHVRIPV